MVTTALFLAYAILVAGPEEGISNLPASVTAAPLRTPQPPEVEPVRVPAQPEVRRTAFETPEGAALPREVKVPRAGQVPAETKLPQSEPIAEATEGEATGRKITPRSEKSRFSRRPSGAEETSEEGEGEALAPSSRRSTWWITTALGLAVVLGVIYGGGRALKAFVPGMSVHEPTGPIQVLYRTFLSPKQVACLVRCGDRILLVGLSGDRMQTLAEIRDPTEIDYIKGQCESVRPRATSRAFRDMFRKSEEVWSPEEQGAPVTFATSAPPPASTGAPAGRPAAASRPAANTPDLGDFAKQLDAVRAKLFAGKARSGG